MLLCVMNIFVKHLQNATYTYKCAHKLSIRDYPLKCLNSQKRRAFGLGLLAFILFKKNKTIKPLICKV